MIQLILFCQLRLSGIEDRHSINGDFIATKVNPMNVLIYRVTLNCKKNRFILSFYAEGPNSTYKTKVNFDEKTKKLYLMQERVGWSKKLTVYNGVTLYKIKQCYLLKTKHSLSSSGGFELLDTVGCSSKVLALKTFFVNGPDR